MSITKEKKVKLIKDFARGKDDTGSAEVQCAIMTARITELTEHFKANPKDFQSRRGLIAMVNKRRRLLNYLKSKDVSRYKEAISRLELRK
ncbi:MAG: 30S ribosomal protein S15 [Proteobacteria bacterium]|nr:30S ribosomal protein S15 [Pseudomonadota bacterium]